MVHAIADNSFLQYVPIIRTFLYDCKLRGLTLNTTSSIDWALTCYMDDMCYVKQGSFNHASKLYSGLVTCRRTCGTICHARLAHSLVGPGWTTPQK